METHQKSVPKKLNTSKFKISKKLPIKTQLVSSCDSTPTIADLKKRKEELMRSTLKTSYNKKLVPPTQARTNDSEKNSSVRDQKIK